MSYNWKYNNNNLNEVPNDFCITLDERIENNLQNAYKTCFDLRKIAVVFVLITMGIGLTNLYLFGNSRVPHEL